MSVNILYRTILLITLVSFHQIVFAQSSAVSDVLQVRSYKGDANFPPPPQGITNTPPIYTPPIYFVSTNVRVREYKPSKKELKRERDLLIENAFTNKLNLNKEAYEFSLYKALEITNYDGLSSYYIAKYLVEENSFAIARDYIDTSIKINNRDADFLALKAYIEFKLGNKVGSKRYYNKAENRKRNSTSIYEFSFK